MKNSKLLSVFIFVFIITGGIYLVHEGSVSNLYSQYDKLMQEFRIFQNVFKLILTKYVDDVEPEELLEKAIEGMTDQLDPHSVYMKDDELQKMEEEHEGKFYGIGFSVTEQDGYPMVIAPIEGTPAFKAGFLPGDLVIEVDGESTKDESLEDSIKRMKGPKGTLVQLLMRRSGEEKIYDIIRDEIPIFSIPYSFMLDDEVGYIKVVRFAKTTADEFDEHMGQLLDKGMTKLVLDLRNNPGGLLEQAVELSSRFVGPNKLCVFTQGKHIERQDYMTSGNRPVYDTPIVVLINNGSASASEILSGNIQDHDRGIIVGQNTFGKGLVQRLYPLTNDLTKKLKLTIAKYYIPSGRCIQRDDYEVSVEEYYKHAGEEADTLSEKYYTLNKGRVVYGGGGIRPDYKIENEFADVLQKNFLNKNVFFRFAFENSDLWGSFQKTDEINEDMINEFKKYIAEKHNLFNETQREELYSEFEIKEKEENPKALKDYIENKFREENKFYTEDEFAENIDWIKLRIKSNVLLKLFDKETSYKYSLDADKELKAALEYFEEAIAMLR